MTRTCTFLLLLLILMSLGAKAQNQGKPSEQKISIEPVTRPMENPNRSITLNESDFIQVYKGDIIKLQPNLTPLPRKHQILKGLLKSAGSFAIAYQVDKTLVNNKGDFTAQKSTNLVPALGFSLAIGLPDMVKGLKNNKSYLIYTLYDREKTPLVTKRTTLKRQFSSYVTNRASADGYMKVIYNRESQKRDGS